MKPFSAFLPILALAGISCAHAPQPYRFTLAQVDNDADIAARTLAAHGFEPDTVDRSHGMVTTRWRDTGYRFREVDDGRDLTYGTNVFLRYRVSIERSHDSETVTLVPEVQRCARLDAVVVADRVLGTCEPMTTLPPTHQREADQLGADLRGAMASAGRSPEMARNAPAAGP